MTTTEHRLLERDLQSAVIDLARWRGWLVFHPRTVTTATGRHMTALQGDAGYPDLTLAHPVHGVMFVELKSHRGRLSEDQRRWLDTLETAGHDARIWRPVDWYDGTIDKALQGAP